MREAARRDMLDFLIPLTDPEVDALAPRKAEFRALGCTVCVPEERVAALCRRKDTMNRFLAEKQVCRLIPTEIAVPGQPCPFPFPVMVKPRSGRSSLGQAVAADEKSYQTALAGREDCIVQPFLEGDIFCVDVARDAFGHTRAAGPAGALRNKSGLGMTVEVLPGHPLEAVCAAIAEAVGLVGVVNMEFIRQGDDFFFLEVNPRFSGGVGFSMAAGMDFAEMMLCCHSCGSVEAFPAAPKHALLARGKCHRPDPTAVNSIFSRRYCAMNVKERFLNYVVIDSGSSETTGTHPSTEKQWDMARLLETELKEMGAENVRVSPTCYVYAEIPANVPDQPAIGLIAHMDTAPAVPTGPVHPRCLVYAGGELDVGNGVVMKPEEFECLKRHVGHELIVTDGTTLLGGDDKAGVAEIMTLCEYPYDQSRPEARQNLRGLHPRRGDRRGRGRL